MKKIIVTIDKSGDNVKVNADGYIGASCQEATKAILEAIGKITEVTDKPELYLEEGGTSVANYIG